METDFLTMPAGPALDAEVAHLVMGWPLIAFNAPRTIDAHEKGVVTVWEDGAKRAINACGDWRPSERIAHAWQVVEHLGVPMLIGSRWAQGGRATVCIQTDAPLVQITAQGETVPLAICRAALSYVVTTNGR